MSGRSGSRERLVLALLLAGFYWLYVSGNVGVVGTNDGAHFATTRALALEWRMAIGDGMAFALNDAAEHEGIRYSNKPPGVAVLATPLYWLALVTPDGSRPEDVAPEWIDVLQHLAEWTGFRIERSAMVELWTSTQWAQQLTTLVSALAGVASLWLLYGISRRLGVSVLGSLATLVATGLGTLHWIYSTSLYSHVVSGALLLLATHGLVLGMPERGRREALAWGLLLGFGVAVEYPAALSALALLAAFVVGATGPPAARIRVGAFVCAGGAVFALLLGLYHWLCFGSVLATPVTASAHAQFEWSGNRFVTLVSGDLLHGLHQLVLERDGLSLLTGTPISGLALLGWLCWPRAHRRLAWTCGALVAAQVLVVATHPDHPGSGDYRYLVRILPIAMLPLGFAIDRLRSGTGPIAACVRWLYPVAFVGLLAISAVAVADHLAEYLRHKTVGSPYATGLSARWQSAFWAADQWSLLAVAVAVYGAAAALVVPLSRRISARLGRMPRAG